MLSCFSHVQLFCDSMDRSLLGSSAHEILQARIPEWVTMPSCQGSSHPKDRAGGLHLLHCRRILHCLSHSAERGSTETSAAAGSWESTQESL